MRRAALMGLLLIAIVGIPVVMISAQRQPSAAEHATATAQEWHRIAKRFERIARQRGELLDGYQSAVDAITRGQCSADSLGAAAAMIHEGLRRSEAFK